MPRISKQNNEKSKEIKKINAGLYIRLSKEDEDKDKSESDSISNQRTMLTQYANENNIDIFDYYVDDGYSGTNFDRPDFQRMMQDIIDGKVNCVMVKDLSRFGRDYIDSGRYLEKVFPAYNIRFISIIDREDTAKKRKDDLNINTSMKNIINDYYAQAISVSIRKTFDAKRKKGEFIGAFTPFGYKKDPDNKNKLIIDDEAADVVREIFNLFINGQSKIGIAKILNVKRILSPTEYKRAKGFRYDMYNRLPYSSCWTYSTIHDILNKEVYIGNLVQKRYEVISYKVKKLRKTDEEEQIRVENTHEPIISKELWEKAQLLLKRDTRKLNLSNNLALFAGFLKCGDCGRAMARTGWNDGKHPMWYTCGTYKKYSKTLCSRHAIKESEIYDVVFKSIKNNTEIAIALKGIKDYVDNMQSKDKEDKKNKLLEAQIDKYQKEKEKNNKLKKGLYEDFKMDIISKEQYQQYKLDYEKKGDEIAFKLAQLEEQKSETKTDDKELNFWIETFSKYKNITELNRDIISELIDNIFVYEDKKIEIKYRMSCEFVNTITNLPNAEDFNFEDKVSLNNLIMRDTNLETLDKTPIIKDLYEKIIAKINKI